MGAGGNLGVVGPRGAISWSTVTATSPLTSIAAAYQPGQTDIMSTALSRSLTAPGFACAAVQGGPVYCAGNNADGQLGNGTGTTSGLTRAAGPTNVVQGGATLFASARSRGRDGVAGVSTRAADDSCPSSGDAMTGRARHLDGHAVAVVSRVRAIVHAPKVDPIAAILANSIAKARL